MARETIRKIREGIRRLPHLLREEIWKSTSLERDTFRGNLYHSLRIFTIIGRGVSGNKLFSQAAALSYYSLISLGPLLAITIMISGFVLQGNDEGFASQWITRMINFVAPPTAEWDRIADDSPNANLVPPATTGNPDAAPPEAEVATGDINPELLALIDRIVASARSGTVGLVGSLMLIVIVIQMITSVEKSFNGIWGVRRGRSWAQRIVSYWTIISLGAVLSFAALTLLSATTLAGVLDSLPLGIDAATVNLWLGPVLSFVLITFVLAFFNRFFPNTFVRWRPALIGGATAATLLIANHYFSFLYVHRVINEQSLYGSVGIIPVLMLGLYMFWLFVLVGGQVTYALQNAETLTNQRAWENVSTRTRESLTLAAFTLVCRRFQLGQEPITTSRLATLLRVPSQILNTSLNQLSDLGLISVIEPRSGDEEGDLRLQPARPLESFSLSDFHEAFARYGNNAGVSLMDEVDPIVLRYRDLLADPRASSEGFGQLLARLAAEESPSKPVDRAEAVSVS